MTGTWADIALVMFVGMGPVKVLIYYLGATRHASPQLGRRIALRAVATATMVTLGLLLVGSVLMQLLHFSSAALIIAGGIVLLAYAIQTFLSSTPISEVDVPPTEGALRRMAVYPMGIPLILNPAGIAAAMIFSAEAVSFGDLGVLATVVLAIAALDVVVLWIVRPLAPRIPAEGIVVLEQVLGVLLAAVAVELIVLGLGQLGVLDLAAHP